MGSGVILRGSNLKPLMSALGQKRTLVQRVGMSALCQKQTLAWDIQKGYVSIRSTHCARQALASKGSPKYCVSRATLSPLNSMMLTV